MADRLREESALQILPSLVAEFGLNEAIVLQQIHYLTEKVGIDHQGRRWIKRSLAELQEKEFPCFWSLPTLRRIFKSLTEGDNPPLLTSKDLAEDRWDHTLAYAINPNRVNRFAQNDHIDVIKEKATAVLGQAAELPPPTNRSDQNDHTDAPESTGRPDQNDHTFLIEQESIQITPGDANASPPPTGDERHPSPKSEGSISNVVSGKQHSPSPSSAAPPSPLEVPDGYELLYASHRGTTAHYRQLDDSHTVCGQVVTHLLYAPKLEVVYRVCPRCQRVTAGDDYQPTPRQRVSDAIGAGAYGLKRGTRWTGIQANEVIADQLGSRSPPEALIALAEKITAMYAWYPTAHPELDRPGKAHTIIKYLNEHQAVLRGNDENDHQSNREPGGQNRPYPERSGGSDDGPPRPRLTGIKL